MPSSLSAHIEEERGIQRASSSKKAICEEEQGKMNIPSSKTSAFEDGTSGGGRIPA
jgi:hypothetical protein